PPAGAGDPDEHSPGGGEGDVDPEQAAPSDDGGKDRSVERPEHAAELLEGTDDAEGHGTVLDVPLVPDDGEGDRQQRTCGGTLQHPGAGEDRQAVGQGRDRGAGGEDEEGALEHPHPAEPVGELAEQGHGCDVTEQVPGY